MAAATVVEAWVVEGRVEGVEEETAGEGRGREGAAASAVRAQRHIRLQPESFRCRSECQDGAATEARLPSLALAPAC